MIERVSEQENVWEKKVKWKNRDPFAKSENFYRFTSSILPTNDYYLVVYTGFRGWGGSRQAGGGYFFTSEK